ncbi:hypothetical protein Back2_00430 [Nocardioides baekrokdamisoli]|uniref:Site-specific integrase n=1 Tax=Nocardioides baekrokdamisoli TaxID=1804624 RepID=A0A3G9IBU8_9ACTN|nr:site-specific integrase [Nocardioides baekrokdamisoli]BBH15756.1 hypothetical protein Back2_00430 [Nocardioides baekrokdamisoli]
MASVVRIKYGPFVVAWGLPSDAFGSRNVQKFDTKGDANLYVTSVRAEHPDAIFKRHQEQGIGKLCYEVRFRDDRNRQRTLRFDRKVDAEQKAADIESDKSRGRYVDHQSGKVTFQTYAETYLKVRRLAATSRLQMESRFKNHVYPVLGHLPLAAITPEVIAGWLHGLSGANSTRRLVLTNVSAVLNFAVDNKRIASNPCSAPSLKSERPKVEHRKVVPWTGEQVDAIESKLVPRYRPFAAIGGGLGVRQGEMFGLATTDINWFKGTVHIQRQVLMVGSKLHFAPPKFGKTREVPVPNYLRDELAAYLAEFPPVDVTLPWSDPRGDSGIKDGTLVTVKLILTSREHKALNKNYINDYIWKPAVTAAGIEARRDHGMHALRHHYASTLLAGGVSIREVSERLGHSDPGFTLRVYTHLMPGADDSTKSALDRAYEARRIRNHGLRGDAAP